MAHAACHASYGAVIHRKFRIAVTNANLSMHSHRNPHLSLLSPNNKKKQPRAAIHHHIMDGHGAWHGISQLCYDGAGNGDGADDDGDDDGAAEDAGYDGDAHDDNGNDDNNNGGGGEYG